MSNPLESHLRDLEAEARQAEIEAEDFRDRGYQRIAELNQDIANLVAKVQAEKEDLKERTARKVEWAQRKIDEYQKFKASLSGNYNNHHVPALSPVYQNTSSTRPSVRSEHTRASLTSLDDLAEPTTPPRTSNQFIIGNTSKATINSSRSPPPPTGIISAHKYIDNCPVIVKDTAGNWVEIRCFLCGGNSLDKKGWIRGARGMLAHIGKSHHIISYEDRKLDSTNLLDYCTIRQVLDDELNDIIDMNTDIQIKMIPCRDIDANRQATSDNVSASASAEPIEAPLVVPSKIIKLSTKQPLKLATGGKGLLKIPAKLPGKAPGDKSLPGVDAEEEEETDEAFDYLLPYPTVVCRPDKTWVELRCDVCGGNSIANSDRRYAHGVVGFNRHLSRGHGQKSIHTKTRLRLEEVLKRCTYREVSAAEIESLSENNSDTIGIEKIAFTQTAVTLRKSAGAAVDNAAPKRARVLKRTYTSEPEDSELELEEGDSDFDPMETRKQSEPTKRARHSVSSTLPRLSSLKNPPRLRKRSRGFSESGPPSPVMKAADSGIDDDLGEDTATEDTRLTNGTAKVEADSGFLDKYCPCTIGGHDCRDKRCTKIKICLKQNHDDECSDDDESHIIKPSCVMAVLGAECPDGTLCTRGHDYLEDRQISTRLHECSSHA